MQVSLEDTAEVGFRYTEVLGQRGKRERNGVILSDIKEYVYQQLWIIGRRFFFSRITKKQKNLCKPQIQKHFLGRCFFQSAQGTF